MFHHDDPTAADRTQIEHLIARLEAAQLSETDTRLISRLLRLLLKLIHLVEHKNSSISRLKRLLFGPGSDTRAPVASPPEEKQPDAADDLSSPSPSTKESADSTLPLTRKGHGRLRSAAYTGAAFVACTDPTLNVGGSCPERLCTGHLYDTHAPAILIRLTGQPLVGATRFEQEVLRCSACQTRFTASLPDGVPPEKYDGTADVAITLAKYHAGVAFHRLARVQASFGVPLPESIQFARCEAVADAALPVFLHLRNLAAQADLLYADDTRVKILSCLKENKQLAQGERRGLHTTGIVAKVDGRQIALYTSGRRHAGENIDELLRHRAAHLPRPKQMGDALSANWSREYVTRKLRVLNHAKESLNVSKTCRHFGISRETFYQWKRAYKKHGESALINSLPMSD